MSYLSREELKIAEAALLLTFPADEELFEKWRNEFRVNLDGLTHLANWMIAKHGKWDYLPLRKALRDQSRYSILLSRLCISKPEDCKVVRHKLEALLKEPEWFKTIDVILSRFVDTPTCIMLSDAALCVCPDLTADNKRVLEAVRIEKIVNLLNCMTWHRSRGVSEYSLDNNPHGIKAWATALSALLCRDITKDPVLLNASWKTFHDYHATNNIESFDAERSRRRTADALSDPCSVEEIVADVCSPGIDEEYIVDAAWALHVLSG